METGQIRLNKVTREWVIYAPSRRSRPQNWQMNQNQQILSNAHCPFCPGHEHELEPIIWEIPNREGNGWQIRVIPNKYPALSPQETIQRRLDGIYLTMAGYGKHEVIIESPHHQHDIPNMPLEVVEMIIDTYYHRYLDLMNNSQTMMVIIFRNHGLRAGASLAHPHSQIIATGIVPQHRRWQEEEAQRYYDEWGRCVYCDLLAFEQEDGQRVISENQSFLAFVPYAAQVPCEVWIMPKKHEADFGSISSSEKLDFAQILQNILKRLATKLGNPDYNYVINTAARYKAEEPQVHWYCKVMPRLTTPAGFEIASGININPSIPELDAEFLRS